MYLPRLRRISDVIKEMRAQDEDTVITRHIIKELIHYLKNNGLFFIFSVLYFQQRRSKL